MIYNFMHMVYFSKILLWKWLPLFCTIRCSLECNMPIVTSSPPVLLQFFPLMIWPYLAVVLGWCVYIPCCWGITRGSRHRQTNQKILEVAECDHCRRLHCWQYLLQNIFEFLALLATISPCTNCKIWRTRSGHLDPGTGKLHNVLVVQFYVAFQTVSVWYSERSVQVISMYPQHGIPHTQFFTFKRFLVAQLTFDLSVTEVIPVDVTRALEVCLFCHTESFVIADVVYP
jgi:hypothetical protein